MSLEKYFNSLVDRTTKPSPKIDNKIRMKNMSKERLRNYLKQVLASRARRFLDWDSAFQVWVEECEKNHLMGFYSIHISHLSTFDGRGREFNFDSTDFSYSETEHKPQGF